MTQQARPAIAADLHALVAAIERSQILLSRPATCALIPYKDEVDIAVLKWIASHVRSGQLLLHVDQLQRRIGNTVPMLG